jgi:antitoxin YefM
MRNRGLIRLKGADGPGQAKITAEGTRLLKQRSRRVEAERVVRPGKPGGCHVCESPCRHAPQTACPYPVPLCFQVYFWHCQHGSRIVTINSAGQQRASQPLPPPMERLFPTCGFVVQVPGGEAAAHPSQLASQLYLTIIMVMTMIIPLADAKARLSAVLDDVRDTHDRVVITRNGRPEAVIISVSDLETIEETLDLLSTPGAMDEIRAAEAEIARGEATGADELRRLMAERVRNERDAG